MKKIRRNKIKRRGRFRSKNPLQYVQDYTPMKLTTRHRLWIVTCMCLLCLFITLTLGQTIQPLHRVYGAITRPVQRLYLKTEDTVTDWIATAKRLRDLEKENQELTQQLELYVFENAALKNDVAKMEEIQELYNLDNHYEAYPKTGAQIVGLSNNNWYETYIIDKGANDGMAKYMPVLASGGLVGHISEVYDNYAVVTTIIDSSSTVYGEVNRKLRDTVSVSGSADLITQKLCKIEYDPQSTDLVVGDDIVTSALGEIYPPGLLIGTVIEIEEDPNGLYNVAYLNPASDLEHSSYVLVITQLWKDDMKEDMAEGPIEMQVQGDTNTEIEGVEP